MCVCYISVITWQLLKYNADTAAIKKKKMYTPRMNKRSIQYLAIKGKKVKTPKYYSIYIYVYKVFEDKAKLLKRDIVLKKKTLDRH